MTVTTHRAVGVVTAHFTAQLAPWSTSLHLWHHTPSNTINNLRIFNNPRVPALSLSKGALRFVLPTWKIASARVTSC